VKKRDSIELLTCAGAGATCLVSAAEPVEEVLRQNVAIHDGHWEFLINADGSNTELFDLRAEPEEKNNVAGKYPEISERLSKQALIWRESLPQARAALSLQKNLIRK
jgi:hypothetical protein